MLSCGAGFERSHIWSPNLCLNKAGFTAANSHLRLKKAQASWVVWESVCLCAYACVCTWGKRAGVSLTDCQDLDACEEFFEWDKLFFPAVSLDHLHLSTLNLLSDPRLPAYRRQNKNFERPLNIPLHFLIERGTNAKVMVWFLPNAHTY